MSYRFKVNMRQYRAGDPVPEGFEPGVVATMLERGFIEPASCEKKLETVPENKSMTDRPVARKKVAPPNNEPEVAPRQKYAEVRDTVPPPPFRPSRINQISK